MADPVFDEDSILGLLSLPTADECVEGLRSASVQTLMDLYDRKVTRDEFIAAAGPCLSLYGQVSKLWMLHNIRDAFNSGDLTADAFVTADGSMRELMRKQADVLIGIVKRLQMCPTSQDRVH